MEYSSFCGIKCEECKLCIATITNDGSLKLSTVKDWGLYKDSVTVDDISCRGCKSDIIFGSCKECDIRQCNQSKNISYCGECTTYPCDRINKFYTYQIEKETGVSFEDYVIV